MESRLQTLGVSLLASVLGVAVLVAPAAGADKPQTYTGVVSDAMCGAEHMMDGTAADCTHACVTKGSKYALVVGTKVYTLETTDKTALAELDKMAGAKVMVSGTASSDSIAVKSVAPGK